MFNLNNVLIKYSVKSIMTKLPPTKMVNLTPSQPREPSNKANINPADIDDYIIIGAEIFRNSLKDVYSNNQLDNTVNELEVYRPKLKDLKYPELDKYSKYLNARTLYDQSDPKYKHIFTPSYRFRPEPFNSLPLFKFSLLANDRNIHNNIIFKKNDYVQGFVPPFNINFPEVENILKELKKISEQHNIDYNSKEFQNEITDLYKIPSESEKEYIREYTKHIDQILNFIPHMDSKILPNLVMSLFYDYNINDKRIWIAVEQEALNNLHHYDIIDISKIYFVSYINSPKYTSIDFRRMIFDKINKELSNISLEELFSVCVGLRMSKEKNIYNKIGQIFIDKKDKFLADESSKPSNLSKIFYSWASNKPTRFTHDTYYPHRDLVEKFIETYEDDLNANIMKMNTTDVARLCTALYLLKSDNVDPFINRVERNLSKNKENMSAFDLWAILKSFSKMKDNKMVGSDKFFDEMEPYVINNLNSYNLDQFSDILYAYSIRGSGSDKLNKLFDEKVNEYITKFNSFRQMYNIIWYLLFTENKNEQLWLSVIDTCDKIEGKLPLMYYQPFKLAGYYLEYAFPNMNLYDFKDRFFDPEQVYDYVKYERHFEKHYEYITFKAHLNARHFIFPLTNNVINNCLMINYCFETRKIGINLILDHQLVPKTNRPNKKYSVHRNILKNDNWEILELTWQDYFKLGDQDARDKFIHNWWYETSVLQEKKGIFRINPKIV